MLIFINDIYPANSEKTRQ